MRTPDATAIVFGGASLTYRELDARANQLAHFLRRRGVGPDTFVAICAERSLVLPVALLGVLKAGGAYLPLDPSYPTDRLSLMMRETDASIVLTQSRLASLGFAPEAERILLDDDWRQIAGESPAGMHSGVRPDHVAYVMYTSGSTGTPRGVLVPHGGVVNQNLAVADYFGLRPDDRVAQCTSLSFDISVEEFFPALMRGASIVLHPPGVVGPGRDFMRWLGEERISVVDLPTAFWHEWVAYLSRHDDPLPPSLRLVVVGGQRASSQVLATWRAAAGQRVRWVNGYGPTEATIASVFYSPDDANETAIGPNDEIPIGRPIVGTSAYVLEPTGNVCAQGVTGELFIGGAGVTRGYLGQPALTAERFLPDPFSDRPGARMYRTGDLAQLDSAGRIHFLGRADDQVKVRGFRVELGEVEAALRQCPGVHDAVVTACDAGDHDKRLAAYVVFRGEHTRIADVRAFLAARLPSHMVPADITALDALPLTPTGKIDKRLLPEPRATRAATRADFVSPSGEMQLEIARIWSAVLGIDEIGAHDNFFDLGGHSLRATQVASRIRDAFGIEVPLAEVFAQRTVADLARVVESRRGTSANRISQQVIPVAPRDKALPLSFSQERVWFLQRLDPSSLAYNFQTLLLFTGRLDVRALEESLTYLIERHEILRTTFVEHRGVPLQEIHSPFAVELPVVDLRELPEHERHAQMQRRIDAELTRSFDMERLPLIRWTLFRLYDDEYAMLHVEHHLIHDGWSFNVFRRDLLEAYAAYAKGAQPSLAELPVQFADYAAWQRTWMTGDIVERQLDYWRRQLADAATIELPMDHARPQTQTFGGSVHEMQLDADLYAALRNLSDAMGTTLFVTLQAAFMVLLHRYSGQDDISVGSGVANRRWTETEGLLGMLVNNVVLRSVVHGDPTFRELASNVRRTTLEAYDNQDVPFDHVVRAVGRSADGRNPLFQVMFSFHDSPLDEPELPGLAFRCIELLSNRSAKFDLNVVAVPHAEQRSRSDRAKGPAGITLLWEYNTALFETVTVEQMAMHYSTLLGSILADADRSIFDLQMMSVAEQRAIIANHNRTSASYPSDRSVHAVFAERAAESPERVAVVCGDRQLTYRELDTRANAVAQYLRATGVGRGASVGVCLERGAEEVVAVLAILKAGAAFVPLEPAYPDERLDFVGRETGIRLVLADAKTQQRCAAWGWPVIDVAEASLATVESAPAAHVDGPALAYVMFTSGSTGQPKGAAVTHRAILRLVFGTDYVEFGPNRRTLHMASLSFDSSTFELWGALLHGGTLVVYEGGLPSPRELGEVLRDHAVDTLWLTASMFNNIIDEAPDTLGGIRQLVIGGEALSVSHVARAQRALPHTRIVNGYGPTESTTFACCHPIIEPVTEVMRSIPIGKPIGNTRVYLLDRRLNPVPIGVPGELYIAGDGLAHGYVGQPAITAERFLPDPFHGRGERMYRSGDVARYRRDGLIEFLGRADDQVKIRGYRIEPGEIENALRQHPAIRDAAVVARDDLPGGRALVAYVTASSDSPLEIGALRDHLRATLPSYMIPARFVALDSLPLTTTGKVNRRLLPAPPRIASPSETGEVDNAHSDVERLVTTIWRETLQAERLSVDDNFFDLGGHSLMASRIIGRIREELLIELPLRALFENPTVAGLSRRIAEAGADQFSDRRGPSDWRYLFLLRPDPSGRGAPIFFMPGGRGGDLEFLVYARLAHFVGDGFSFYGLRARSADGVDEAHSNVEEMASDYIDEMRTVQPHGPYRIVGNCIGGVVAFEVARQLALSGEGIETLVLMDTEFPTAARQIRDRWKQATGRWNLTYYWGRLAHHARAIGSVPWRRRLRYLLGRARNARILMKETPVLGAQSDPAEQVRFGYVDTLRGYRPLRYPGAVTIIASRHDDSDPTTRWATVIGGPITVLRVEGDHESYIRDHVREAALRLRTALVNPSSA